METKIFAVLTIIDGSQVRLSFVKAKNTNEVHGILDRDQTFYEIALAGRNIRHEIIEATVYTTDPVETVSIILI